MGVLGIGMGLMISQLGNVIQSSVDESGRSEAGGLQFTGQQLGSALGVAFIGAIVLHRTDQHASSPPSSNDPRISARGRHASRAPQPAHGLNFVSSDQIASAAQRRRPQQVHDRRHRQTTTKQPNSDHSKPASSALPSSPSSPSHSPPTYPTNNPPPKDAGSRSRVELTRAVTYREFFSHAVDVVEAVGATILIVGGLGAFARYVREIVAPRGQDAFGDLRKNLGRVILLGLEVLIIADIIRTIVVDQSVESVVVLGTIVLIRVVLSFSLEVEIDGMWPWNRWRIPRDKPPPDES